MALITTLCVTAAGAAGVIMTLIVGTHPSRFETTLRLLRGKRGPLDQHPSGRIHYDI